MAGVSFGSRASAWRRASADGLVVRAADALGCHDAPVVRALEAAVRMIPEHHTVSSWAREMELEHRQSLHELFTDRGLPPPKEVLDHMRLARLAVFAAGANEAPTRDELACRFGYSSGDYLGKTAKRCLRMTLGTLLEQGPRAALDHLARVAAEHRTAHV